MAKFLAMWCLYDPDNYLGHRLREIEAVDRDDAERQLFAFLNGRMIQGRFEYRIEELATTDSSYRVYDSRTKARL